MNNALWDKVRDVVIVLLIPALGWVLMVSRAIETERIHATALRDEVADLKRNVERLQERDKATSLQLVRLETRLDGLGTQLTRIEGLVERLVQRTP
ncbi:MAG: hypothetical protein ACO395_02030 [Pontimonas sp.]|jgi:hypothetical protein